MNSITLKTTSALDAGLLLTGLPLPRGVFEPDMGLQLHCGKKALPLWWQERAYWPDGSVKWLFLHGRVPGGENDLTLRVTAPDEASPFPPVQLVDATLEVDSMRLCFTAPRQWEFQTPEGTWELIADTTDTDLDPPAGQTHNEVVLLEPSPVSPLLRVKATGDRSGFITEQLLRMDATAGRLIWTRRMTWNRDGRYVLRKASALLQMPGNSQGNLFIPQPAAGFPDARLEGDGYSLAVEKAWQRAPFGMTWEDGRVSVDFYPGQAKELGVLGGTSFRHTVHLCCGKSEAAGHEVTLIIDPEYLCSTAAIGMIQAATRSSVHFPGFERSFHATLDAGRLTALETGTNKEGAPAPLADEEKQDADYFGLQHYGDWPMPWGAYGVKGRRMYASNEYDPAYAYFQGYAMYGDWQYRKVAEASAIHMTDVDSISTTGDMRFHGYGDGAEDHEYARSGGDYGHYWTDGHWMLHFFSGDVWAREAGQGLADLLIDRFSAGGEEMMRRLWAGCERSLGWPIVALIGAYEATGSEKILKCIRSIVGFIDTFTSDPDREIEEEAGTPEAPISWWRTAMEDGCKPFMVGVIIEGLERFHRVTGDDAAARAILNLAGFLVDRMWLPHEATFIYEWNAYGAGHRSIQPHSLVPLFVRGLGYAYEISGDEKYREVSEKAFHACLWTLYDPAAGGKSIGIMGRTLGAYVSMLDAWNIRSSRQYIDSLGPSTGAPFTSNSAVRGLLESDLVSLLAGRPAYEEKSLVSNGESYVASRFREPALTDSGSIEFRVNLTKDSTTWLNQRCYVHLCDEIHTRSCVSVISFYTKLHVRIYDENRKLIEVAASFIKDYDPNGEPVPETERPERVWEENEWHTVRVVWRAPGHVELYLDGTQADRKELNRPIGGEFTRLHIGHKPGNWRALGRIELLSLELG